MSSHHSDLRGLGFLLCCAVVCTSAIRADAQDAYQPPAHISFVDGSATVEHDGELVPAVLNMPIVEGDRLRTANGHLEVMFPDGSAIEIDPFSDVELLTAMRVRVIAGAIEHRPAFRSGPQSTSGQYLPQDLQAYGQSMDQNGSWQYESPYGYVWYPSVADEWRPYYYGYWSPIRRYGWTWIGFDLWSWPTHHYGRWGFGHNRWFWIPGRTWAPAWVSWAAAPGYVSWCPLGFDSRPVFALSVGYSSTWRGWTVVPRDQFGVRGFSAHRLAVEPRRFGSDTPFIAQRTPPVPARGAPSVGASAGTAVPRYQGYQPSLATPRVADGVSPSYSRRNPSDQPRVAPYQSPAIRGQSPVAVPRYGPSAGARAQSPILATPQSPAGDRPSPGWSPQPRLGALPHARTDDDRRPTPDYRPPTNDYRFAAPRDYRPPTNDYRPAAPRDYRPPTSDYRRPAPEYRLAPSSPRPAPAMPRESAPSHAFAPAHAPQAASPPHAASGGGGSGGHSGGNGASHGNAVGRR